MRDCVVGYAAHYRAGEKPCDGCRDVYNEQRRLRRRYGPLSRTPDRIADFLVLEGPTGLRSLMTCVVGVDETVRRTVYRMVGRGDITRNPVTLCYSVGSEER